MDINMNSNYLNNYIMKGGDLLSEGGFGCVFHPGITCSGDISDDMKLVSKIQVADKNAKNEVLIGKKIKKLHGFINYFSPIITQCPITVKKIKDKQKDSCELFKKHKDTNFTLMKMVYINGTPFTHHLMNLNNKGELIINLINSYNHLLKSLSKLKMNGIVHFDIKGNNIIFNSVTKVPIIIDFGLSILIDDLGKLTKNTLKKYFYVYAPEYYIWPIEVHYMNFLLHKNANPTENEILQICIEYVKENAILNNLFSPDFLLKYTDECFVQLRKYNKMEFNDRLTYILNTWDTWDNYALSFIYFKLLIYLNITGFYDNTFLLYFSKVLLKNIHPNPNKRFDLTQNIHNFNRFFYSQNYDRETFEDIKDIFETNIKDISRAVSQDAHNDIKNTNVMKNKKNSVDYDFQED